MKVFFDIKEVGSMFGIKAEPSYASGWIKGVVSFSSDFFIKMGTVVGLGK